MHSPNPDTYHIPHTTLYTHALATNQSTRLQNTPNIQNKQNSHLERLLELSGVDEAVVVRVEDPERGAHGRGQLLLDLAEDELAPVGRQREGLVLGLWGWGGWVWVWM